MISLFELSRRMSYWPQYLLKSRSREIRVSTFSIAVKLYRHLGNSAVEMPAKFQWDTIIMTPNPAGSTLQEIWRFDVLPLCWLRLPDKKVVTKSTMYQFSQPYMRQQTLLILTQWGWVTHICVANPNIIDSDDGLSSGRCQAIIWISAGILLIGNKFQWNLNRNHIFIQENGFQNVIWKMVAIWCRPQCVI